MAKESGERIFVSTDSGEIMQINGTTLTLEYVFVLQAGPISAISISRGYCAVGAIYCDSMIT